ncbi:MAG TPA: alpha/beta hydrolase [Kofleriaceae bacterium]|jgi:pimeloyl-ACP methyl ester carboxylesterase
MFRLVPLLIVVVACGASPGKHAVASDDDDSGDPFVDSAAYKPHSFVARVSGDGRPVIFIPGLGCPGSIWNETVAHLGDSVESHVLTLAGFAGVKATKPPLAATVRRELVRYIHAHKLVKPIIVGHSMGGFIAYWLAATAPDLIGGVIVVDAGPALAADASDQETAQVLRNAWAQAGDDELPDQVRTAYTSMVSDPKEIEPFLAAITKSDRQTMGDAIYELVTTDLRDKIAAIHAPLLLVLADGGYQQMYRTMVKSIPDHEIVVIAKTKHFVMLDDPAAFDATLDKFLKAHPAP